MAVISSMAGSCGLYELMVWIGNWRVVDDEEEEGKRTPGADIWASCDSTAMSLLLSE
jgi:hypothetical protein